MIRVEDKNGIVQLVNPVEVGSNTLSIGVTSVSYTHLDVYKRQVTRYGLLADVLTQRDGEDATAEARDILAENGVERTASVLSLIHI